MDTKQSAVSDRTRQEQFRSTPSHRAGTSPDLEHADSDDIREDIHVTRSRMDETLDELSDRLNPRHLVDDLWGMFRSDRGREATRQVSDSVGEFGQNLGRQLRDNPVPSLLIGAGLAWMAFGGGQRSQAHDDELADEESWSRGRSWGARGAERNPDYWTDEDLLLDVESDGAYLQSHETVGRGGRIVVPEGFSDEAGSGEESASWKDTASKKAASAGQSVSSAASSVKGSATKAASAVGDKASGAASATGHAFGAAKDSVTHAASSVGSSMAGTAGQVQRGARSASRGAYQRSRAAGRGVSRSGRSAGRYMSRQARSGADHVADAYHAGYDRFAEAKDDYPLGVGLGFLALGMLAGLVTPRTRYEDELMGEASDEMAHHLAETGEELFEQGKEVVHQAVDTAKHSAEQHGLTGDNLTERATRVVEKSAAAFKDAAKDESLTPSTMMDEAKHVAEDVKKSAGDSVGQATSEAKQKVEKVDPDLGKAIDKASKPKPQNQAKS